MERSPVFFPATTFTSYLLEQLHAGNALSSNVVSVSVGNIYANQCGCLCEQARGLAHAEGRAVGTYSDQTARRTNGDISNQVEWPRQDTAYDQS